MSGRIDPAALARAAREVLQIVERQRKRIPRIRRGVQVVEHRGDAKQLLRQQWPPSGRLMQALAEREDALLAPQARGACTEQLPGDRRSQLLRELS